MKRDQWEKVRGLFIHRSTIDAEWTRRLDDIEARISKNDKAIEDLRHKDAINRLNEKPAFIGSIGSSPTVIPRRVGAFPSPPAHNIPTKKK